MLNRILVTLGHMNTLPVAFEERIRKQLGKASDEFLKSLQTQPPVSIRMNPGKISDFNSLPVCQNGYKPVDWCPTGCYLIERPIFTLDPYLHGGAYYVQEASSMFLHHILRQLLPQKPVRMLDLCAAPGGKSTLTSATLPQGSLLISNEIIRNRASVLKENLIKWGQDNIVVTNNAPADFSPLKEAFDFILVDAPCSGEGMFRKDEGAIEEWSESNLRLCAERQQHILTDIWDCLKTGGILIYSTCTYNPAENEKMLEWLLDRYPSESVEIRHPYRQIIKGDSLAHCYHFYPHLSAGEGFFTGVIRKTESTSSAMERNRKKNQVKNISLPEELRKYITNSDNYTVYQDNDITGILPEPHAEFINRLSEHLKILYKGCEIAETNGRKIKLLPALALWQGLNVDNCTLVDTERQQALSFLKKEDIPLLSTSSGWQLITYQGVRLGWGKNVGNRLNNYYPKEWRIRMDIKNEI